MKTLITCTVPTHHQLQSIRTLMGDANRNPDGSFSYTHQFKTKKEATQWLKDRAYSLSENDEELNDHLRHEINYPWPHIKYDAAIAHLTNKNITQ